MRELNENILNVILTIQYYAKFKRAEARTLNKNLSVYNWVEDVEKYYYNIPDEIIDSMNLKKNKIDFYRVLDYKVTDEIMNTNAEELNKFDF